MLPLRRIIPAILLFITLALLLIWLELTPQGLLGKMDAIGYAVCHRIELRSFSLGERPLPLCARCSGMYLGVWVGLSLLFQPGRYDGMPGVFARWVLGACAVLFAIDGVNSYLTLFNPQPLLYQPDNILRLFTGSGVGLAMAAFLAPTFNLTVWINPQLRPVITSRRHLAALLGIAMALNLAMLTEIPLLTYPLAVLTALAVVALLSLAYALVWVLLTRKENTFQYWRQLKWYLLAGFCTTLAQIALVDLARFSFSGTWGGF